MIDPSGSPPSAAPRHALGALAAAAVGHGGRTLPGSVRELLARFAFDELHPIAVLAPDGTLLVANERACALAAPGCGEVVGRRLSEVVWRSAPGMHARLADAVARAAGGEEVRYDVEVPAAEAGARPRCLSFSLRPVRDAAGAVILLLAEARDVSEKRLAEAILAKRNDELRALYERVTALDRLKTDFFANVSHELRTPLALVLGPIERLLERGDLPAEDRDALGVAERNARTVLKHVNALLEVARIEGGAASIARAHVDLAALVRLAAAHFEAVARERGVRLQVEAPAALPAEVDPDRVERVVLNLLSNAFKFTPDGGRVRVSVRAGPAVARIEVADSGPGIAPEHRAAVFERFRQLDGARRQGGIGLGLPIAKDLVELHGGRVAAAAAPEGGALLVVDLPIAAPQGEAVAPAPAPPARAARERAAAEVAALGPRAQTPPPVAPAATGDRPLVLVVEDNPEMSAFVRSSLAPEYRTAAARDGVEGLRLARTLRPDLVVTDVMIPDGRGDVLVRAVRADPALAAVPVLVLTAMADDALRARLLADGANDYVAKPVAVPELRARVRNLVQLKRARDVLQEELADQAEDVARLAGELAKRRRELETALDAMRFARAQADRASAQKSTLMRLVSHELRTPLSALLLQVERMRRDAAHLSPAHRDAVARMRAATQRLSGLVESLLEYARVDAGRVSLQPEPLDPAQVAAEVLDELRPHAEQKGLVLEGPPPGSLPPLETDPRMLRLVLLNLVSNGVKFTDAGRVAVELSAGGGEHVVVVRDTGRGIAPEDQARIFEPFEQLEEISLKHTPGIGLGLALVREMVNALGGRISLVSTPGAGSAFSVALPSSRPRAADERAPGASGMAGASGTTGAR